MIKEKPEEIREKKIVKHGTFWCIQHTKGPDKGKIMKGSCKTSKEAVSRQHRSIMRNEALRKKEFKYDAAILTNEELFDDAKYFIGMAYDIINFKPSPYIFGDLVDVSLSTLKEIAKRKYQGFCNYVFDIQNYPENSVSYIFWKELKKGLSNGEIAILMMGNESYNRLEEELYKRKSLVRKKSIELCDKEYKEMIKTGEFENKALPKKYYKSPSKGTYIAQVHVIGITQQEYDDYESGKIPLWKSFVGHSVHVDWRGKFKGSDLLQIIIVESSIAAYLRVLQGGKDKKTNNVAKGLMIVKDEKIDSSIRKKAKKEMILNPSNAKKIEQFIIKDKSFFISPGNPGATKDTYGYLGCIGYGKVETGILRDDYFELFCTSSERLPLKNKKIFDGRWIWKAFKKPRYLWWCWEASTNPNAGNSWIGCDQGNYRLKSADRITKFGKEDYSEYKSRIETCKKKLKDEERT